MARRSDWPTTHHRSLTRACQVAALARRPDARLSTRALDQTSVLKATNTTRQEDHARLDASTDSEPLAARRSADPPARHNAHHRSVLSRERSSTVTARAQRPPRPTGRQIATKTVVPNGA